MYNYTNLLASDIKEVFGRCIPCNCYDDIKKMVKVPRYDVMFRYSPIICSTKGRRINFMWVHCDCCDKELLYDVEHLNIYEREINW